MRNENEECEGEEMEVIFEYSDIGKGNSGISDDVGNSISGNLTSELSHFKVGSFFSGALSNAE